MATSLMSDHNLTGGCKSICAPRPNRRLSKIFFLANIEGSFFLVPKPQLNLGSRLFLKPDMAEPLIDSRT